MIRILTALACLVLSASAAEPAFMARVVAVHDGDSITVYDGTRPQIKVRLAQIDAPELKQPYGPDAKKQLSTLIYGQQVKIIPTGKDRYGRTLAEVEYRGQWVNLQMVSLGAAWRYDKYSKNPALLTAQQQARQAKRGLWRAAAPVTPWEWRPSPSLYRPASQSTLLPVSANPHKARTQSRACLTWFEATVKLTYKKSGADDGNPTTDDE
jgi:endonuclease YncB( thermonuclease family)